MAADRIDASAPPSIAAPAVPAWDLAPAEDTLETTPRTQDAAPSAPQAPQWSLATDEPDTATEHALAPADAGAAGDAHEQEPVAPSQALSFDPVAAEQDSWTGTAEPLHISLDSLVLEQDALRPQTPSTLAQEDAAAAAPAASVSDVAGFDPVAAEYPEQAQTDVPAAFAGLDEHDDPNLIIVDTPTAAEDADASTPPLVIELEDAPAFADAPGGSADEVHTLDWHAAPAAQDEQAASALSPDAAALADAGAHIAHGERLDAAAEGEPADAGADAEDAAHAIPTEAAEATDAARQTESHAPMDGLAQTDPGLAAIDEAAHTDAVADAPSAPEHAARESEEHATPEPVQAHAAAVSDAEAAFLADLEAAAAQFDVTAAVHSGEPAAAASASAEASAAPAAAAPAAEAGFIDGDGEIDEEIRAVFLEEFDEELVNLGALLPAWRAAPAHTESLRPIRRVFHTLKGSGRLVGARVLGEFSWKIESMLNRVLDGSRPASPAVVAMVEQAYAVLPQLNAALRGDGAVQADLDAIQAVAERIAAGEEAFYFATPQATVAPRAGTPASVDSVLREILEAEVATHLETVHAWLQHAPQPATEALLRAVHTMSGAFAMTDVPEITAVTGPAESYVKRALAAGSVPSADGVRALEDAARAIAATIAELQAPSPVIPPFTDLAQRLRALVETLPEVQWPPIAHDEDDEDLSAPAPAEAGLDEQAVQAVELTAADDLSAFLGDAAHLHEALPADDIAGQSDAVDADQHRIDVHADAASAQSSDGAAASTPADSDATTDTDAASLASASEDEPLAVEQAAAPHDERDADEQAALAQDGQLDELTVEAPLGAEQVSDLVPEALDPAAQDATVDAVIADAATDTPMDAQELQAPEHAGESHGSEAHPIEAQDGEARDASVHAPESQVSDHSAADRDADADATEAQATDHSAADHAVEDHATDAQASDSQDASAHGQDAQASEHDATHGDADASIDDTAEAHEQQLNEDAPAIGLRQHPLAPSSGWRHDGVASANDDTEAVVEHGDVSLDAASPPHAGTGEGGANSPAADTDGEHADTDAEHVEPTSGAGESALQDVAAEADETTDAHHAGFDEVPDAPRGDAAHDDTTAATETDATASADAAHEETDQHASAAAVPAQPDVDAAQAAADPARTDLSAVDLGPLDFADLDRELVDIFVDEGKDLLDHCDRLIAELRAAPQDRDVLGGLQRDLHTLKGGARMAGINAIGDLGHGIESLLEAVAAHRTELDRQDVQLLERGFDRLHQLLTLTGNHRAVAMPQDLIGAFDARTHGQRFAAASDAETTVAAPLAAADGALAAAALAAVA
ncbi:Hpt domain-containing protein, partial [Xanthomonas sp. SHU 308]|uniref:Hpt domain-containing protein n=1 Tax=Xanthomonas sp. SHU 308 TaxID=1591201 RepID=UPI001E45F191